MVRKGLDVVPILNKRGLFEKYFTLNKADSSKLDSNDIQTGDRLYYLSHVRDAVWKMKSEQKTHYFLTNGRSENDVVGLFFLSNYNCREFYVFLFSLMSYIKREFTFLIESGRESAFKTLKKWSHSPELANQLEIIEKRLNEDKDRLNS